MESKKLFFSEHKLFLTSIIAMFVVFILAICFPLKAYGATSVSLEGANDMTTGDWEFAHSFVVNKKTINFDANTKAEELGKYARQKSQVQIDDFDHTTAEVVPMTYAGSLPTYDDWISGYSNKAYDLVMLNDRVFDDFCNWDYILDWAHTQSKFIGQSDEFIANNMDCYVDLNNFCKSLGYENLKDCFLSRSGYTEEEFFSNGSGNQLISAYKSDGSGWIRKVRGGGSFENPAVAQDWEDAKYKLNYVISGKNHGFKAQGTFFMLKFPGIATANTPYEGNIKCDMYIAFSNLILSGSHDPGATTWTTFKDGSGPFISVGKNSIVVTSCYGGGYSADLSVDIEIFFTPVNQIVGRESVDMSDLPVSNQYKDSQNISFQYQVRPTGRDESQHLYVVGTDYTRWGLDVKSPKFCFAMTDIDQAWNNKAVNSAFGQGYCEHVILYDMLDTFTSTDILPDFTMEYMAYDNKVIGTSDTWCNKDDLKDYGVFYNAHNQNSYSEEDKADTGFIATTGCSWAKYRWYGSFAGTEAMYLNKAEGTDTCEVKIKKISEEKTWVDDLDAYSLKGARYSIYDVDPSKYSVKNLPDPVATLSTDDKGVTNSATLPIGETYYVKEIYSSPGHALDTTIHKVNAVTDGKTYTVESEEPVVYSDFGIVKGDFQRTLDGNDPQGDASFKGAQFRVDYYDGTYTSVSSAEKSGAPKSSATFETNDLAEISVPDQNYVNASNWKWTKNGKRVCPIGTYVISEVKSVDGYYCTSEKYLVSVKRVANAAGDNFIGQADRVGSNWVDNQVQTGNKVYWTIDQPEVWRGGLDLIKVDSTTMENWAEGNATLEGAEFRIYNVSTNEVFVNDKFYQSYKSTQTQPSHYYGDRAVGKYNIDVNSSSYVPIYTLYTDKNGHTSIPNNKLPYGTYVIYEIKPPNGYLINSDFAKGVEFTVRSDGQIVDFKTVSEKDKHYWDDRRGAWDDTKAPNPSVVPVDNPPGVTK